MTLVRVYCGLASADSAAVAPDVQAWLTVALVDDSGRLLDICEVSDDPGGYAELCALFAQRGDGHVGVAVATDSDEHMVTRLLNAAGRYLAYTDEDSADDYAERFADDDSPDEVRSGPAERRAVGLARALQAGVLSAVPQAPPRDLIAMKPLLAAHAAMVTGRQHAAGTLREVLRELYPAALRAYADPAEPVPLAVIDALPEPGQFQLGPAGRTRETEVVAQLADSGVGERATLTEAVTALRVAAAETPRRSGVTRAMTAAVAETIRYAVAAVRACDRAGDAMIMVIADRMSPATPTMTPLPAQNHELPSADNRSASMLASLRVVPEEARGPAGRRSRPLPAAPTTPSMPAMPAMPSMPAMPAEPAVPSMPAEPAMPAASALSGSDPIAMSGRRQSARTPLSEPAASASSPASRTAIPHSTRQSRPMALPVDGSNPGLAAARDSGEPSSPPSRPLTPLSGPVDAMTPADPTAPATARSWRDPAPFASTGESTGSPGMLPGAPSRFSGPANPLAEPRRPVSGPPSPMAETQRPVSGPPSPLSELPMAELPMAEGRRPVSGPPDSTRPGAASAISGAMSARSGMPGSLSDPQIPVSGPPRQVPVSGPPVPVSAPPTVSSYPGIGHLPPAGQLPPATAPQPMGRRSAERAALADQRSAPFDVPSYEPPANRAVPQGPVIADLPPASASRPAPDGELRMPRREPTLHVPGREPTGEPEVDAERMPASPDLGRSGRGHRAPEQVAAPVEPSVSSSPPQRLSPEVPAPGSRSSWPVMTDPTRPSGAEPGREADRDPLPTGAADLPRLVDLPRQREGRVMPPWQADDLPAEPPTLRLVEPAPLADPALSADRPTGMDATGELYLDPPALRLVDSDVSLPIREDTLPRAAWRGAEETPEPPIGVQGEDSDLLIFSQCRSAWFTDPADESDDELDWVTAADRGWEAAEQAARPAVGGDTGAGLPRRVPQQNLVPGSPAPVQQPERQLRIVRDAASIAAHTSGYFSGYRRGQEVGGYSVGGRPGRESAGGWDFTRETTTNDYAPSGEYEYRSAHR